MAQMSQGLNGVNVTGFKWRKCHSAFFAQINTDSKYPLMLVETEVSTAQRFSSAIKLLCNLMRANVTMFKCWKCHSAFFAQINTDSKYPLMLVETEVSPAQRFSSAIKLLCNLMRANVTVFKWRKCHTAFFRKYGRSCVVVAEATQRPVSKGPCGTF